MDPESGPIVFFIAISMLSEQKRSVAVGEEAEIMGEGVIIHPTPVPAIKVRLPVASRWRIMASSASEGEISLACDSYGVHCGTSPSQRFSRIRRPA